MEQKGIWKPIAIILAVLIALTIIGMIAVIVFGGTNLSVSSENKMETTELTALTPEKDEIKVASSITITSKNGVPKEEDTEESEEMNRENTSSSETHRYEVINSRMTWSEAKSYCESLGGHLATIESQDEYNKVIELANASGRKVLWLGAQKNSNQTFEWITGESFQYSYWLSGEPNNEGGNENYLVMFLVSGQWVWADVPNDVSPYYGADKVGFVCEYDE